MLGMCVHFNCIVMFNFNVHECLPKFWCLYAISMYFEVNITELTSCAGEIGRMYEANVDDVGYRLVAIYTPVREDGVEGQPISVSTEPIAVGTVKSPTKPFPIHVHLLLIPAILSGKH